MLSHMDYAFLDHLLSNGLTFSVVFDLSFTLER